MLLEIHVNVDYNYDDGICYWLLVKLLRLRPGRF